MVTHRFLTIYTPTTLTAMSTLNVRFEWEKKRKECEQFKQFTNIICDVDLRSFASSFSQVFRYSALVAGILYGFTHDLTLKAEAAKKKEEVEYQKKVKLIAEAKAEYKKLHPVAQSSTNFNLEDPNLDFGKVVESYIASLDN